MAITINGSGTITGISAGGLPDGSVTAADLADTYLTPTGDGSGLTGISSGWTPISTVSTGTASYVELALPSSYDQFVVVFNEVQVSTGTLFSGAVSTDSGSTYESTDYWHWADGGSQTSLKFISAAMAHQSVYPDAGLSGQIGIYGSQSSSTITRFDCSLSFQRETSLTPYKADLTTAWGGTTVVDKVKFYPESGNFTSGTVTLYGLAGA